jgi:hypothetical protein
MLARLRALSDQHFDVHSDEVTWVDIGTLGYYDALLQRITDCASCEGEHARRV